MVIQNNTPVSGAYRYFRQNNALLKKNLERLSSGYRINRAGDDAAGLAISEKMRAQISGLEQARRNIRDGISLIQTAEGATTEIHDILNRVKTLSEQAANGTLSDFDRGKLQQEVAQLNEEVERITKTTNFNGIHLFQDEGFSAESVTVAPSVHLLSAITRQFGKDTFNLVFGETEFDTSLFHSDDFRATQTPMTNSFPVEAKYRNLADTLENSIVPQVVNSIMRTYTAFSYLNSTSLGMGLKIYNDPDSSVMATVSAGLGSDSGGNYMSMVLYINAAYVGDLSNEASRSALERTISHEMIHAFMDETHTAGMFGLHSNWKKIGSAKFPKWFSEGIAQTASGPGNWLSSTVGLGLRSNMTDLQLSNALLKDGALLFKNENRGAYGTGYLACMYLGYMADGANANMRDGVAAAQSISRGISKILGDIANGDSLNTVIKRYTGYSGNVDYSMYNYLDPKFITFVRQIMPYCSGGGGGLLSGDLSKNDPVANDAVRDVNLFKLYPNYTAIKNTYPAGVNMISGGDRSGWGVKPIATYTYSTLLSGEDAYGILNTNNKKSTKGITLQIGTDSTEQLEVPKFYLSSSALGLDELDISTQEGAVKASDHIDSMIDRVSTIRGTLGALQNRLEHTYNNLGVMRENIQDAESTIRDTDMAEEMMKYTKNNILVQSAQSMLAQANQNPRSILSLIQG